MECCLIKYNSESEDETIALGESLASKLKPGSVVALKGILGAGKTYFVKGIARGLNIQDTITSPTYTIVNEYTGILEGKDIQLFHIDAYRLSGDDDFVGTGVVEFIGGNCIAVIEWSDRIPLSVPPSAISVSIEIDGPQSRIISIRDNSP